ncbi:MAG: SIMPL domain-containing protein [Selenomonadaceae bacterium]|nr:SIMPL domain-containing protein [Selenomonadaceae bacterium]
MAEENITTEEVTKEVTKDTPKEIVKESKCMKEFKGKIHIKGTGRAAQVPDQVVLSLTLTAQNKEYSAAMKIGNQQLEMLRESISDAGFKADDLKTVNFNVRAVYENEEYKDGKSTRNRQVFVGFECRHDLKLTFDLDNKKLNKAVDTIAACLSKPKISIAFTIKDIDAFNDEILRSAAKDARRKAKTLCSASKVKLGRLLDINYSLNEQDVYCEVANSVTVPEKAAFNFRPEEITASDTVEFLWEID